MKRWLRIAFTILLLAFVLGLLETQLGLVRGLLGGGPLNQRELAMQFLGQYLASQYPGQRVIVLSNPFSTKPGQPREIYQFERAGLRGLRRGLGSALAIEQVVFPELRAGFEANHRAIFVDPRTTTPLSYVVAEDALDNLARQHPAAQILVSLIGLPVNVLETEAWKPDSGRKFALLLPDLRMIGDQAAIGRAIHSRKIAALVLNKPGAPPENQPLGRHLKMEFDQRFLLVTPETVDRYLQVYPRLFL